MVLKLMFINSFINNMRTKFKYSYFTIENTTDFFLLILD